MSLRDLNNSNLQQYLPFSSLSDSEFNALNNIMSRELDLDADLYNILPNPDKSDENDSDHMLTNICSNYYSAEKINKALDTAGSKVFSFFHSNIRSLPKDIDLLNDMIYSVSHKPDILAVTETRLNDNTIDNVDIHGYTFYHTDSPTKAGGAEIYVRNNLKTMARPDINFSMQLVESCWVEIESSNFGHNVNKNIIIGCIYRHPKANIEKYTDELDELLKHLNQRKYQVVLLGDVNIDFLNSHQPTERYLDMLYENNFIPVITKPTWITDHTKTLIDHIYTNTPIDQVVSDIGLFDISDHLLVF
jgi:exonuclease III